MLKTVYPTKTAFCGGYNNSCNSNPSAPIFLSNMHCLMVKVWCKYKGQSINSDNGSISQKILSESELFVMHNVEIGVAYSCLKYGVFIMTGFDAMKICIQHCECSWPRKSPFKSLSIWG